MAARAHYPTATLQLRTVAERLLAAARHGSMNVRTYGHGAGWPESGELGPMCLGGNIEQQVNTAATYCSAADYFDFTLNHNQ